MLDAIKSHRILLLLTLLSSAMYVGFAYDLVRSDFIKLISLYAALFFLAFKIIQISKGSFWVLAGIGVFFRLIFLGAIPNLSQDFYRFLWDGRLLLQGINPYLFTPEAIISGTVEGPQITIPQAEELYRGMGSLNASHFSNYPPINQLFFAIAAIFTGKSILGSVIVLRIVMVLADLGILYFGKKLLESLNLPANNIFWYFLNPFIIIELTGNLHFEGLMLFFIIWSLYLLSKGKWVVAAIIFGISISVKLIPLLLLPLFYRFFMGKSVFGEGFWKLRKFIWIVIGTVLLTFVPFFLYPSAEASGSMGTEFISNFSSTIGLWFQKFEFNASFYYIIRWIGYNTVGWNIIATVGKILPFVVLILVLMLAFFRRNKSMVQLITTMLFALLAYFLLSTTVHPWYIATPLLLSVFTKYRFPIVWSFMVMLSYSAYGSSGFSENLWLVALEYLTVIGFACYEIFTLNQKHQIKTN